MDKQIEPYDNNNDNDNDGLTPHHHGKVNMDMYMSALCIGAIVHISTGE